MEPKAACAALKTKVDGYDSAFQFFVDVQETRFLELRELDKLQQSLLSRQGLTKGTKKYEKEYMKNHPIKLLSKELQERYERSKKSAYEKRISMIDATMPIHLHLGYTDAEIIEMRKWNTGGDEWKKRDWENIPFSTESWMELNNKQLKEKEVESFCKLLDIPMYIEFSGYPDPVSKNYTRK